MLIHAIFVTALRMLRMRKNIMKEMLIKLRQAMKSDKNYLSSDLQKAHTVPVLTKSTA